MGAIIEINTDGLAKLGEIFSHATGLAAYGNKKLADADFYSKITMARAENEIAIMRMQGEEEIANFVVEREKRKLNNVFTIAQKAASEFAVGEEVSNEPVNQDWTNRFFRIAEDISDDDMQNLWARILAGEVKQPKSYSLRTLDVVRNMSKEEAESFVKASKYFIVSHFLCCEDSFAINIYDAQKLIEIGLLNETALLKPVYPQTQILITNKLFFIVSGDKKLDIPVKALTSAGKELLGLLTPEDNNKFIQDLANYLKQKGATAVKKIDIIDWISPGQYRYNKNLSVNL